MANANWSNPQLTSSYTSFVSEVKNRDEDLALQFDGTTSTNILTNTIRWDSTAGRWKKWTGTAWGELAATYALTGLSTTGAATIGTTLGVTGAVTGSSTITGTALIPSGSSVPVNGIYLPSANSVAIATNSLQRLLIDSSGNITAPGTLGVTGAITGSSTITSAAGSATAAGLQVGTGTTYKPGIYSPGTDQLAICNNGTQRLLVDGSGNIKIGWIDNGFLGAFFNSTYYQGFTFNTNARILYIDNLANDTRADIVFRNGASGALTEKLRLDTSGNVGIGVTPSAWGSTSKAIQIGSIGGSFFTGNTTAGGSLTLGLNAYFDGTNFRYGTSNAASYYRQYSGAHQWFTAPSGTADAAISFTQAMTLDASGRLLVGTIASPAYQLQLATDSAGKPSTNTWTIVSDQRIKEDIELADLSLCYQAIKNIPLKRFKWKDEVYTAEQVPDRHKLGWIAEDVEAVFPKAVRINEFRYNQVFSETVIPAVAEIKDRNGNVTTPAQPERIEKELISEDIIEDCRDLNADQLYAAMYGAIQMLMAKVETLEAQVAALQAG